MKKILVFLMIALCAVSCLKTFAQTNVNAQSVRLASGRDTVTFSPQPNGTLLYGNGSTLSFKTGTGWKKVYISPPTGSAFWNATGGTTIINPTLTGNAIFTGNITAGNITVGASSSYLFNGSSAINSPSDGSLTLTNSTSSTFSALNFGGATASFPSLLRSTTGLILRLGNTNPGSFFLIAGTGGTVTPTTNGILDVQSTSGAFIPPRMTTAQRDAIGSPSAGMVVYNITTGNMNTRNATIWLEDQLTLSGTDAVDYASIATGTCATRNTSITNAVVGDPVAVAFDIASFYTTAGIVVQAFVSSAGQVSTQVCNTSGAAFDPASANMKIKVFK